MSKKSQRTVNDTSGHPERIVCYNCGFVTETYAIVGPKEEGLNICMPCLKSRKAQLEYRGLEYVNNADTGSGMTYNPFKNIKVKPKERV
jgi:hypothetical protein